MTSAKDVLMMAANDPEELAVWVRFLTALCGLATLTSFGRFRPSGSKRTVRYYRLIDHVLIALQLWRRQSILSQSKAVCFQKCCALL